MLWNVRVESIESMQLLTFKIHFNKVIFIKVNALVAQTRGLNLFDHWSRK